MQELRNRVTQFPSAVLRLRKVRVLQNLGWLTGGQLFSDLVAFIFFVLLSRSYGPEGVGVYAFGLAIASVGRTVASMGVDDYGIRKLATRESEDPIDVVGKILGAQCWLAATYAIGCALFLGLADVSGTTAIVVIFLTTYHLSAGLARSLFLPAFAQRRMAGPALLNAGSRILAIVGGIVVVLLDRGSLAEVLVGFPIFGVLLVAFALWKVKQDLGGFRVHLSLASVFSTAKQALPFAAGEIVFQLYARADVLMLALIVGSAATGIYAAGLKFVEVAMMGISLFAFALYPRLTRLAEKDEVGFKIAVTTLIKGGFVGCVILAWGIFVFVPDLVPLFFGSEFSDTELIVKLFALLAPLMGLMILGDRLMLAAGKQVQKLRFQTIATGLNIAFNAVLIPILAIEGAIIASVVSVTVNVILLIRYLERYSSERLLRRLVVQASPLLMVGLFVVAIGAFLGTREIWVSIAFMISFLGAVAFTGFGSMIQTNISLLAKRGA